ncbi:MULTISPECIES: GntR family transcriptional regulator [unclassified Mesorhizobium]|uniref:GntR family transcriptional regulator n=1 Tax=unclassified Mesorhizobium TaxID=325217 RepID=UPI000FCC64E0|nr:MULTISPECIES: GntR family transcriptional regulator [unclassified Mesorhizobium]TGP50768.1 GntR family transcriptional regulator [bacterium M00.F.Ca.ET.230.01.1.1]TGT53688.1 GntR family transcriptional regulator [Mesorhizobium sp. M00.F.Ca.ET.170.01.1.1]RUX47080.1 GntR family transcriptional regulator [Mesorhizobium sp. M4A.F.Ca.ET.050.02.1.1]RWB66514.1 MAG: GntR family transcriptional regulator [Mesorhizobium sp.]RWB90748.1 MAG: GntR family transcriptional regulator [Mesorhizobium sp.]
MQEVERNIPLGERVYDIIKKMITDGELPPNQVVPESVLAKQLGVSRSPVKAALTRLQEDGLVVGEAWKVPYVAPLDAKYVSNAYQVRKALDSQCAIQAIGNIPAARIEEFGVLLDKAQQSLDTDDPSPVRNAFFFLQSMLREYCDNDLLRSMQGKLNDHLTRIRTIIHSTNDGEWLKIEYWMLKDQLEALRSRDAARLVAALNNQHDQFVRWLFKNWSL